MAALGLTPTGKGLTPDQIKGLLRILDRELGRVMDLDEPLTMLVVGGAAISMQWDPGRYTKDVDVVSQGLPPMLWKVVADVAKSREGVALDWLNDAAQLMVPVPDFDPEPTLVYEGQNIHVYGASARYVLAMKAVSARVTDIEDLPTLLTAGEFDSFDEVLETVAQAHGRTQLPAVTQNKLRQAWDDALTAAAMPERGYLSVNPDYDNAWGWQLVARHPDGEPIERSATYPTKEAARSVADLAVAILDPGQPLSFVPWAPAAPPPAPIGRGPAVRVSVAHKDEAWQIRAVDADGYLTALSQPYTSHQEANEDLAFLATVSQVCRVEVDSQGRGARLPVQVHDTCACVDTNACRHYETAPRVLVHHQPVPANPITVSVRADRASTWGWELVAKDPDGSPRQVNGPYPTAETAEAARDFAMSVVNKDAPLRVVGWSPADVTGWDDTDYTAPAADVAVTIQLAPAAGVDTWQLQAADPDGTVFATSQEYQGWQTVAAARHWLGMLGVMAGDTAVNGPVRDTTLPTSRVCGCESRGAECHHHNLAPGTTLEDLAHQTRQERYRGPSLGL